MKKKLLFQNGLALLMCLFLFAGASFAQTQTSYKLFETTGTTTWSLPTDVNVTSVTIEAIGGGGGGGSVDGYNSSLFRAGGGGSGAAYAKTELTSFSQGQTFTISVGDGGVNTPTWQGSNIDALTHFSGSYSYSATNGGASYVSVNGSVVVSAAGGVTVSGRNNTTGATALAASQSTGDVIHVGGNGSNAYASNEAEWQVTSAGSGGGAGGASSNGGNGSTSTNLDGNNQGGVGGGGNAGNGGKGEGTWNSLPSSNAGLKYGGGGSGAWCTGINWSQTGGIGGTGMVLITYTYTNVTTQSVSVTNASANVCAGANFDVTLNITAEGFDVANATVTLGAATTPSGVTIANITKSYTEGKWHVTGTANNNTNGTLSATIPVTVTTPDGTDNATATITLNVYGELDGGVIAADQFVCQDQTIQIIKGNGDVVYSISYDENITTAPATGGSGDGDYQWLKKDVLAGDADYQPVSGTNSPNYTPSTGLAYYQRTYTDNVCGTTVSATDGNWTQFVYLFSVNPFDPGNLSGTDNICSDEAFTKTLEITEFTSPASSSAYTSWNVYWQKSVDNGATWTTVASNDLTYTEALAYTYTINVSAGELTPGEIQYRYALEAYYWVENITCTMVPCNGVYKLIVGSTSTVDYTEQFTDKEITLYYGECERDITDLAAPDLNPVPASIERGTDGITTVTPGNEYNITWIVVPNGSCSDPQEYTQKVIVKFPACGTLEEPYVVTDNLGNEYNTIRIGCDCWLAENLRTNATNATYYDNDDANEAFGRLYDWNDAVGSNNEELPTMLGTTYIQGVCPKDWAIPTVEQYTTMMAEAGSVDAVKSDDENAWLPDLVGTNTSGFAAMGAGFYAGMEYQRLLGYTDFWTADVNESNTTVAKAMELRVGCDDLLVVDKNKADKISVRCVRVEPVPSATDCGTVTIDGVDYETVIIGSQCWTKRNLRTTVAADGTPITNPQPVATSNDIPYYYKFKYSTYSTIVPIPEEDQGYLYNWAAALVVCPTGWHLPSDAEWTELEQNFTTADLSGTGYRGDHAGKLAGTDYWKTTNTVPNAPGDYDNPDRNVSGFTAVPAGHTSGGSYGQARSMTKFWSSTEYNNDYAWYRHFFYNKSGVGRMNTEATKKYGLSVRCVKDSE